MEARPHWQEFALWLSTAVVVSSLTIAGLALLGPVLFPVFDHAIALQAVEKVSNYE